MKKRYFLALLTIALLGSGTSQGMIKKIKEKISKKKIGTPVEPIPMESLIEQARYEEDPEKLKEAKTAIMIFERTGVLPLELQELILETPPLRARYEAIKLKITSEEPETRATNLLSRITAKKAPLSQEMIQKQIIADTIARDYGFLKRYISNVQAVAKQRASLGLKIAIGKPLKTALDALKKMIKKSSLKDKQKEELLEVIKNTYQYDRYRGLSGRSAYGKLE